MKNIMLGLVLVLGLGFGHTKRWWNDGTDDGTARWTIRPIL